MREESHLDEMRSAIRGDFERLAERRGDQELMRVLDDESEPGQPLEELSEPEPVEQPELDSEPELGVEQPELDSEPEPEGERRSWLARLFSPP